MSKRRKSKFNPAITKQRQQRGTGNSLKRKSSRFRARQRLFNLNQDKILAHPYWGRPLLGDAVAAWVNYKIETTLGLYAEQKFNFFLQNNSHSRLTQGKRHLTSIEVKSIADDICGYTTGDEMFPAHLTHEQAIDHIEICEMIREYWESAVYNYFEAEERYFIIRKYNYTHPNAQATVVEDLAVGNQAFWKCDKHYGALDGKKGELVHNWLSLCGKPGTAARGYHCNYCQKLEILMNVNKTDRYCFYKRERDIAVTSFQHTNLLLGRLDLVDKEGLLKDFPNKQGKNKDPRIMLAKIIVDCVVRQTNERKGELTFSNRGTARTLTRIRIMRYGSEMGNNTMNEVLLKRYENLYKHTANALKDQDLTITPPELCTCPMAECTQFDFITDWRKLE